MTVNTLSYAVDQGRYGASQVNYVTKSGTNQFHGNLYELWNGSSVQCGRFFTNATPGNHKPRSTVNHFGGSLGGPILHDKLFFFLRQRMGSDRAADRDRHHRSDAGISELRFAAIAGGWDRPRHRHHVIRLAAIGRRSTKDVSLVRKYGGHAAGVLGLSVQSDGRPAARQSDRMETAARIARAFRIRATITSRSRRLRIDYNINEKNTTWFRFQADTGLQAAYTDPINPLFNAISPQPLYSFAAGYTHVFSQNLVNYFNPAFSWYESLFGPARFSEDARRVSDRAARQRRECPFTTIGGLDNTWVQGRRASRFFINDNLAWSHRRARTAVWNQHPNLPAE